jgi:hypothetical protein
VKASELIGRLMSEMAVRGKDPEVTIWDQEAGYPKDLHEAVFWAGDNYLSEDKIVLDIYRKGVN